MIEDYFPYPTPRANQIEASEKINEAIESGYDYIILDAGTGFGKSAVARTIMDYNCKENNYKSFLLTATKQLQNQYFNDTEMFNSNNINYKVGLGRSNFTCKNQQSGVGFFDQVTCDIGYCKTKAIIEPPCIYGIQHNNPYLHGGCNYWKNKAECMDSDVAIMNYNVLIADNLYVDHYDDRTLMVCDEAHNIEQKIMGEIKLELNQKTLNRDIGYRFSNSQYKNLDLDYWIAEIENIITQYQYELKSAQEQSKSTIQEIERLEKRIKSLIFRLSKIQSEKDNFAVCPDYFNHKISFKPIFIREYVNDLLLNSGELKLFMSGSFIDYKQFCQDLDIPVDEVYYHKAKSSFNTRKNNPIYYRFAGNLGFKTKKQDLPKTIPQLQKIFNKHHNEKGLIHCNSIEFKDFIMESFANTKYSKRLVTYDSSKNEGKGSKLHELRLFKESDDPLILVSYSMQEGIDLPYDNCRFQIFYKAPFLPTNDNQIKARMERDPNWYNIKAIQKVIQMWGRGMRAEDDYSRNYIIDKGFYRIIKNKKTPNEFLEAII